ncbi:MAG: hypothetical protein Q9214_006656, partial [Letrouitia sp. 1 TL-2023]
MNVAQAIVGPCQYCVNITLATVKATMLMQFASLVSIVSKPILDLTSTTDQYITPTAKPNASSTNFSGKSIRAPVTGRTLAISARQRSTEKAFSAAKRYASNAPTGPEADKISADVWYTPIPTNAENAMP